jgi:glucose/arabinose dehydrogenase
MKLYTAMKTPHTVLILGMLLAIVHLKTHAQLSLGETPIDTLTVASNLDTPWEILWGPDDHIWITERYGRISRLDPLSGAITEVAVLEEVHEQGEGGLLGLVLHPDFSNSPFVFLVYTYLDNSRVKERLVRYTFEGNTLADPVILLEEIPGAGNHNGSRLAIDSLHYLYMTTGDAANTSTSQNLNSLNGKVLRLNLDGSIPEDNPVKGSPVWSWGHRNPQGLVFAPSGLLYSSEHGPSSDDELNIIEKGRNYGWPQVKGFCDEVTETQFCADSNVYEPMAAWTPTLAVAGADYYGHTSLPEWDHSILVTSLKASRLVALKLSDDGRTVENETHYFQNWFGRLRDLCVSPRGDVYLAVSNRDGRGTIRPGDDRIVKISAVTSVSARGISEDEKDLSIRIYPNPLNRGEFTLEYTPSERAVLTVYNETGVEILSREIYPDQSHTEISLPDSGGLYLLRIREGNRIVNRKLIKL